MKRSIATVSVSGSLPEKLRAIAAAGFDGVEIFDNDLVYYPGSPAEIRELCAELGLEILLFQPFRDFEGGPRETLAQNLPRGAQVRSHAATGLFSHAALQQCLARQQRRHGHASERFARVGGVGRRV